MLQRLPRLSVLALPEMPFSDAAVQQLAAMQGLQQVRLSQLEHMPACDLQRLPSSLTQLHFCNDPSLPPQLQQLPRLMRLHLQDCHFLPALLGSITQLQGLHLERCQLLPSAGEGIDILLDILDRKLLCLQDLELRCLDLLWDPDITNFPALTASSHLTRLALHAEQQAPLPDEAMWNIFQARQPTHTARLRELQISAAFYSPGARLMEHCIDASSLRTMYQCCPALESLDIRCTMSTIDDLSYMLLWLPRSCTQLKVGGLAFTDEVAPIVAQLTHLRDLSWHLSFEFTDAGLQCLTALTRLDRLNVFWSGLSEQTRNEGELVLTWDPEKGSVSQQLAAVCSHSRTVMRKQKRQKRELARLQ